MMMPDFLSLEKASQALKAMGHPVRLRILQLLSQGERTVGDLGELLGIGQANLSQHLNLMKDKGLLTSRRAGNQVFYRLRDNRLMGLLALVLDL
ncbi:MAG: ArsR/SmtB family transcription factor, partial [Desulfobacca sp.]|uniref:ArsR/SmtB family transcription factor n=1 Tax=Desulfobacca sp. TaxID=2067990 RepID=UPI00404A4562